MTPRLISKTLGIEYEDIILQEIWKNVTLSHGIYIQQQMYWLVQNLKIVRQKNRNILQINNILIKYFQIQNIIDCPSLPLFTQSLDLFIIKYNTS